MKLGFQVSYFLWHSKSDKEDIASVYIHRSDDELNLYDTGLKLSMWGDSKKVSNNEAVIELEDKLGSLYQSLLAKGEKPTLKELVSHYLSIKAIRRGYIYIARDETLPEYLKIGFSKKPKMREATLQAQKPSITFIRIERGTTQHERMLHEHLKDRRVRGEWFRISPEEAEEALVEIISKGEPELSSTVT